MTITFSPDASAISRFRQEQATRARLAGEERRLAQEEINRARRELVQNYSDLTLRRGFNGPDAETERLVWFWFNHFNVFWQKGLVGVAVPDYVDNAIRPHVRGSFREMLLSVLSHPAMLVYLDNVSNTAGRGNENLARELLELHTLGVNGGYSQADVREVARILTGMGLRPLTPGGRNPEDHPLAMARGEFLFDPYKHQDGAKQVLGTTIQAAGFAEVEALAELLTTHPATARHISGKLSRYLLGEASNEVQQAHAASAFAATQGDLASTVAAIQQAAKGSAPGRILEDPYRYVTTAAELLRGGEPIPRANPIVRSARCACWGRHLSGRAIHCEQARLREADLHQDRDVRVLNEYQCVLSGVRGEMYGLDAQDLRHVFPGLRPAETAIHLERRGTNDGSQTMRRWPTHASE